MIAGDINESNITFELEHDAEIIADNLKIKGTAEKAGIDIVSEIMKYIVSIGLFQESNGHIFCFKLLKRLDSSMTSNTKLRTLITKAKEHHDKVMINHDDVMQEEKRQEEKRTDKTKQDNKRFVIPTVEQIKEYCTERNNKIDAEYFFNYYQSKGWMIGKNKMKDWKSAVHTWEKRENDFAKETPKHDRHINPGEDDLMERLMKGGK